MEFKIGDEGGFFYVLKGEKMKKCVVCCEPILGKEVANLSIYLRNDYVCPNCKTEYEFESSLTFWIVAFMIFLLVSTFLGFVLNYDLGRKFFITFMGVPVFYHSVVFFKANGFLITIKKK